VITRQRCNKELIRVFIYLHNSQSSAVIHVTSRSLKREDRIGQHVSELDEHGADHEQHVQQQLRRGKGLGGNARGQWHPDERDEAREEQERESDQERVVQHDEVARGVVFDTLYDARDSETDQQGHGRCCKGGRNCK
jgi:myo-inositol-1-phosphate synthase